MPAFKDHFSGHAEAYARARPGYPAALFSWLAAQAPGATLAWDVGAGNGQVASGLAGYFERVMATDASAQQLAEARGPDNVTFQVEAAEHCSLDDGSVDLVTVGQALHWFDLPLFYAQVRRVLRAGGLFAAWTYQLNVIAPPIDALVQRFYHEVVGPYWPPERVHVEQGYEDLPFPFAELTTPDLPLQSQLTLPAYLAYIDTWSSVRRYREARGQDPLVELAAQLAQVWGDPEAARPVVWPLSLRAGRRI